MYDKNVTDVTIIQSTVIERFFNLNIWTLFNWHSKVNNNSISKLNDLYRFGQN